MFKRLFDILFSLLFLSLTSPIFIIIAISYPFFSKGPIFYVSQRLGLGGRKIKCYKFRSMEVDAEKKLPIILNNDPSLHLEWSKYNKLKDDPRITKWGRFLRKTSLDELPQLINVLIGDLSIVGPRALTLAEPGGNSEEELRKIYGNKMEKILSVKPGLTGIWQTEGRSDLPLKEKIVLDENYVDKRSFLLDLKIILKTPLILFSAKGAY